jgi:hypothetical protein
MNINQYTYAYVGKKWLALGLECTGISSMSYVYTYIYTIYINIYRYLYIFINNTDRHIYIIMNREEMARPWT